MEGNPHLPSYREWPLAVWAEKKLHSLQSANESSQQRASDLPQQTASSVETGSRQKVRKVKQQARLKGGSVADLVLLSPRLITAQGPEDNCVPAKLRLLLLASSSPIEDGRKRSGESHQKPKSRQSPVGSCVFFPGLFGSFPCCLRRNGLKQVITCFVDCKVNYMIYTDLSSLS